MRAEVKYVLANDIPNWPVWEPPDPAAEFQWFTVCIAPAYEEAADLFQVVVASPQGIAERRLKHPFRGLVVSDFSTATVEDIIRTQVAQVDAPTWEGIVRQLQKAFAWEFTDYH